MILKLRASFVYLFLATPPPGSEIYTTYKRKITKTQSKSSQAFLSYFIIFLKLFFAKQENQTPSSSMTSQECFTPLL